MPSNWEKDFFSGVALDAWRLCFTPEQTRAEVDFLARVFHSSPDSHFLDVPCGNGRHAIEFANRGFRMTALDLSEEFLAEARRSTSLPIRWFLGDMRELAWDSEFDGAYCFGNSFAYLDADDARKFFSGVARGLKRGARLVVETGMAAESILPTRVAKRWYKLGDIYMLSENRYVPEESRLDIDYTFIRGGEAETRPTSSYVHTVAALRRMQSDAGLKPLELLDSIEGEPYQLNSPRLILIAEKA
jgi:SAM-dependent methyltransferase